jgi:hypothetical protein
VLTWENRLNEPGKAENSSQDEEKNSASLIKSVPTGQ